MTKLLLIALLVLLACQQEKKYPDFVEEPIKETKLPRSPDIPQIPQTPPTYEEVPQTNVHTTYDQVITATIEDLTAGVYLNVDDSIKSVGDYSATWDLLFYISDQGYSVKTMGFGSDQGSVYIPAISSYLNVLSAGTWSTQDFELIAEEDCKAALEQRTDVQRFQDFSQTTTCYSTSNGRIGKLALAPNGNQIVIRIAQFN